MTRSIRVVLIDDHELFREGVAAILALAGDIAVVGSAADADGALEVVMRYAPDIVLLDVEMPGVHVSTTLARILRMVPESKVIILTMHQDQLLSRDLRRAGASAYVSKTTPSAELMAVIRNVHAGTARVDAAKLASGPGALSPREREVIRLISHANSNGQIAAALSISVGTVKRHTNNIYKKLGATSRIDALRAAQRLGIIAPSS